MRPGKTLSLTSLTDLQVHHFSSRPGRLWSCLPSPCCCPWVPGWICEPYLRTKYRCYSRSGVLSSSSRETSPYLPVCHGSHRSIQVPLWQDLSIIYYIHWDFLDPPSRKWMMSNGLFLSVKTYTDDLHCSKHKGFDHFGCSTSVMWILFIEVTSVFNPSKIKVSIF